MTHVPGRGVMWIRIYEILSEKLCGRGVFELTLGKNYSDLPAGGGGVKTKKGQSNGKAGEFFTVHLFSAGTETPGNQELHADILYEDT